MLYCISRNKCYRNAFLMVTSQDNSTGKKGFLATREYEIAIFISMYLLTYYSIYIPGNYSVAGFELTLRRKVSHYIITYYLPSGMFVIVSWISFLVPPEIVPGRMTLLVTVFLVLVNIFNTITTNIPKAEGLTGNFKIITTGVIDNVQKGCIYR